MKGVNLISFNSDGKIVEFEVLGRPASALHALSQEMANKKTLPLRAQNWRVD